MILAAEFTKISRHDNNTFEGTSLWSPLPGYPAFGGQIAAQALVAASLTVANNAIPNTLTILFVTHCKSNQNTKYIVRKLRDGSILDMRQVECYQGDNLVMCATFSEPDCNIYYYESETYKLYEDGFIPFIDYISRALSDGVEDQADIKYQVLYENMSMMLNVLDVEVGKKMGI